MSPIRRLVNVGLFPVLMLGSAAATIALLERIGGAATAGVLWTAVFVVLVVAEQRWPRM